MTTQDPEVTTQDARPARPFERRLRRKTEITDSELNRWIEGHKRMTAIEGYNRRTASELRWPVYFCDRRGTSGGPL